MNIAARTIARPRFGQYLAGEGGEFVAVMKGEPGQPDYLLVRHTEFREPAPWKDQMAWAKKLKQDGHQDFRLPTRRELHALIAQEKDKYNDNWYWSCEPNGASYAWVQYFNDGLQGWGYQNGISRAVAVRSVILE